MASVKANGRSELAPGASSGRGAVPPYTGRIEPASQKAGNSAPRIDGGHDARPFYDELTNCPSRLCVSCSSTMRLTLTRSSWSNFQQGRSRGFPPHGNSLREHGGPRPRYRSSPKSRSSQLSLFISWSLIARTSLSRRRVSADRHGSSAAIPPRWVR